MAKKKEPVVLEDVELKPQVIGYSYKKKSNLGRVIFIFITFIIVVFYINDISVFINNLLGKQTASTISGNTEKDKNPNNNKTPGSSEEVKYNLFTNGLEIKEDTLLLNNFNYSNNVLTFDASNTGNAALDLTNKKYFLETYAQDETLLERFKIDFNSIAIASKVSFSLDVKNVFYYIVLVEKDVDDYPEVNLVKNEAGLGVINCTKGNDNLIYNFDEDGLKNITHTITNNNPSSADYMTSYNTLQMKVNAYKNIDGITATFNGSLNGYTAVITIDSKNANLSTLDEKYYYAYKEQAKVIDFEMKTYGFTCN